MFDLSLTAHLAELSKLEFTNDELAVITKEMDDIVALMDSVSDFELTDSFGAVEPVEFVTLRDDTAGESMNSKDILANAKNKTDTFFKVPKVV